MLSSVYAAATVRSVESFVRRRVADRGQLACAPHEARTGWNSALTVDSCQLVR